eukprot:scaffold71985_cov46-Attheya_sp.AAC.2
MPRKGQLDQVFHIFAYLKKNKLLEYVYDASNPSFGDRFKPVEWDEFYPDATEDIPHNMPIPHGNEVTINCFVDADHAGNQVTRRSHTGILLFLNALCPHFLVFKDGPTNVFCDNEAVITNLSIPTSTIKKKHLVLI